AKKNQGSGLDKDYALAWSYGLSESFTLFIPNFKGGATGKIGNNEAAMEVVSNQYKDYIKQQNRYWGDQPFTSGPVYFGAIIFFLAVLAMFIVKDKIKWWLLAVTILSLVLSWGKHAGFVTDIFFNYFPFYNKFRTVSMILTIAGFSVPMLAFLGLRDIIEDKEKLKKNLKFLWISLGLTAGLAFIFWLIPNIFNFLSGEEQTYFAELIRQSPDQKAQINSFLEQLKNARITIFRADAIRTVFYIIVGAGALFLFATMKNFKKLTFIAILGVFIILDMWTIDLRYLKGDDFIKKSKAKAVFQKTHVDTFILKDKDPYYRVLNLTANPFNDALTSYHHKSIGGYHGAKLRRYQDVIEKYLAPYSQGIIQGLQDSTIDVMNYINQMSVLNMLNTKYIIYNKNASPIINTYSYGNAWFIDNYKIVNSADEEITALGTENLERTAIINAKKTDITKLPEQNLTEDLNRSIVLSVYKPDKLIFEINSIKGGFVVFSDVYYPVGWRATIDNKETDIYQTNYILRGIVVPPGKHIIKFEFVPNSVFLSNKIALVGSIIVILLLLFSGYMLYKNSTSVKSEKKEETKKIKK
ncbi:MAG: YfhO family protein, partial [Bacteroidota bacterium]|nr:YfhO family protein [Bacteroidota bacterium]